MPSKLQITIDYAQKLTADLSGQRGLWQRYLLTAARVYKYPFPEQLLIFGQRPDATACAPIEVWNKSMGRRVKRGAKGIALIDDSGENQKLKYVFDISDTRLVDESSRTPYLWRMEEQHETAVAEALENAYGSAAVPGHLTAQIIASCRSAAKDNLPDYLDELRTARTDSLLEELDDLNLETRLRKLVENSVAFTVLTRCGIDAGQYFSVEDFDGLYEFNSNDTMGILGRATSDVSRMLLLELGRTIRSAERAKLANQSKIVYTTDKEADKQPDGQEKEERNGAGADVSRGRGLSVSRPDAAGGAGGREAAGQVRSDAQEIPEGTQAGNVQRDGVVWEVMDAHQGDRRAGGSDDGDADRADEEAGGRDGGAEGERSDGMGRRDEQHPRPGGGSGAARSGLRLSHYDPDARSDLPYYHNDAEKNELLREVFTKEHRDEIAAFFAAHEGDEERGNFLRSFFSGAVVEMTLGSGQRVGCQAYADRLHLWRGEPDAREAEEYPSWWGVANRVYGMMLMGQWLEAPKEATADKAVAFALPQEAIDYVLTANGTNHKLRIYEQFLRQDGSAENIRMLKDLYGVGGHSDAIPGSGYWEDHDSKGITISNYYGESKSKIVLPWKQVEKRIGELIAADRYLSRADKAAYPAFRQEREARAARTKTGEEFNSIIRDYNDFRRQLGDAALLNQYVLTDCGQSFSWGRRTTHTLSENNYILPLMRDALQTIIADTSPLKERAGGMLETLNGEIAKPLEPTYEELNPPKKEYRYALGDTVHLGTQKYEILAFNEQEVRLYDTEFPLLNKTMPREEFDRKVAENPFNDRLLVVVEEQAEPATEPSSLSIEDADGYNAIKEAHPDELVLYRVGDFYEMYGEDAKAAARLLDLTVTSRNVVGLGRTEMCGIPAARLDSYVERLRDTQDVVIADAVAQGGGHTIREIPSVDHEAERDIDAQEAEYGADGYRAFPGNRPAELEQEKYELGFGAMGNGLTVWNRLEIENGDYKTIAQIAEDRSVTFYDAGLPDDIKARILEVARTSEMTVSATQDTSAFTLPHEPPKRPEQTRVARNYRTFARLFPEIVSGEYRYLKLESGEDSGLMPLTIERIGEDEIAVAHFYEQNGDLMYDPELTFRMDTAKGTLEPLTFRQDGMPQLYQEVYPKPGVWIPKLQNDLSAFAEKWLRNIEAQGRIRTRAITEIDGEDVEIFFDENGQPIREDKGELIAVEGDTMYCYAPVKFGIGFSIDGVDKLGEDQRMVVAAPVCYRSKEWLSEHGVTFLKIGRDIDADQLAGKSAEERLQAMQQALLAVEPAEKEESLAPPAPMPRKKASPFMLYPEIPSAQRHEYRITDDQLGVGTPSERYERNVAAIRTLKQIEGEDRLATPEEQTVLAQYVGWGGLADCFDDRNSHYAELKALLTDEEYAAARESTLTAFYTPPVVIRAVYKALDNMGFQRGNILEPSCGVGNFLGMKPEKLADSKIYGVELDSISGRIARQLYQQSSIAVQGYEKTDIPDSFFDVALGNVPFGSFKVADKRYDRHNFLIHDYFFARTLDKIRPGGVIAFITSKGTMDKESISVRRYIAQRADLLGAIRLPNTAFKGAAGTEVTSDIIFLQKRDTLMDILPDWVYLGKDENGLTMNQYFIDHPEMVLGEMREVSGPFGPETACIPYDDRDLDTLLSEAVQNITGDIGEYAVDELSEEEEDKSIPADPSVRNFSYTIVDGKIYYRQDSRMVPSDVSATAESRIKGLIGIRDCVRTLIEYQTEDYPDGMIVAEQQKLNQLYDAFVKKYGRIGSRANNAAFSKDSAYFLLSSLEVTDDEGNFVRKADMFSKRTIKQRVVVTSVDTASEALALSLAEKARIDMEYMSELTGKTEEEIYSDLKGVIFLNPLHTSEDNGKPKYLTADEYLSGNVREKLQWAKRSAELYPDDYTPNVQALEAVQPTDLTAAEISVRLGATWLPTDVVEDFIHELFDTPFYLKSRISVHYSQYTGDWNVENKMLDRGNVKANSTYGTTRVNGYKIVEETLNLRPVRIFDYKVEPDGKRTPVLNKKETQIAQGKQELIKQAFQDWVWANQPRRERLCKLYNEKFNATRPREYDGSHLNFVGINPEITLRPHQVNAIAHILYGGNTLLAHVVGAGKTFEMVAAAQESKRLGLCQKSLFVVPNHLTEQWAAEYLQLYPSANVLVATKKDFETKNRKRFCGRIATGDYDAVIIGHSQFEKIPMSAERQRALLEQQLDEIMAGIDELKHNHGERFSIKQMERTKKSIQLKLDRLNDTSRKDDVVTFEELGVDRLFIDEAHYYKNLAAFSKMRNVGGISQTEAQKSSDLYMKCRYLDELTGGRGVVFATGTPISNSMVELYTMQKYLQYGALQREALLHFDSWASTFGETVTAIELAPEGSGYRSKTRFAKFYNLPELMSMFKETADIQTADMLQLPVPKANYHNVVLKPSEQQKEMVAGLAERAERVRNKMVAPEEDNMLKITNDGRKLALDQRLMSELLPDSETGKVAVCAANVFDIWQRTAAGRSTQMVFCDLSTPHGDGQFNVYDDLRDKLVSMGIPAEEIAYIHNAKTEVQKKELFGKVRSGQIRVLIGSTQKMGAGTNVQTKLIALHHLDCPWRPADLQQREGRIIRQGNENPEVEIFTYVTENTFDSYLYQLVEGKQKFIGQIMTSKSPVRSAEDIDETALSYAEIKALCTGNPHIKEKMDLDIDVQRLKLLKSSYLSQKYALEDQIVKSFPQQISALDQRIEGYTADMARAAENTHPNGDGFSPMVIEGKTYTEKKAAGSAILEACKAMTSPDPVLLGKYRGFDMVLSFDRIAREYCVALKGALGHDTALGTDVFGNIQRMDNLLAVLPERRTACEAQLENVRVQLANAKEQVARPFPQEDELKTKSARLDELNILLDMDKRENEVLDDGEISEEDAERNQPKKKEHGIER